MDFGEAIRALKAGLKVARAGWNGRKAVLTGWIPSQSDMLYEDWYIVD